MQNMIFPVKTELENKLPYFAEGIGVFYDQEDVSRPDGYPFYQWIQCRKGKGILTMNGNRYTVSEGQGMLLFPHEPHFYRAAEGIWQVDWIIFRGSEIEKFITETAGIKKSCVLTVSSSLALADKIVSLYETARLASPKGNLSCSAKIYEILTEIMSRASGGQEKSIDKKYRRLNEVISYINENYEASLTLDLLAEIAGISPQYLSAAFKKLTSRSLFEYINMVRIQKSKELLAAEKMQVRAVAAAVGFNDESYFCAAFRRYEGMSPMEFRRLHGG